MRLPLPAALALLLLAGCSSGTVPTTTPAPTTTAPTATAPAPDGDLSAARLTAMLLSPADLPDLPQRRQYARAQLTTQAPPQLDLCRPAAPDAPHATANVLAQSGRTGAVQVFQIVSAYADPAAARAALDRAVATAQACLTYTAQGVPFRVEDLGPVDVGPGASAVHYRLTTPDVVGGDVRTLAAKGRYTVLVSGYGAPPAGQSLLDYQAGVIRTALARLG